LVFVVGEAVLNDLLYASALSLVQELTNVA
jgi:hypothetical protein